MLDLPNRDHDVLSLSANLFSSAQQSWAVFNRYFYKIRTKLLRGTFDRVDVCLA